MKASTQRLLVAGAVVLVVIVAGLLAMRQVPEQISAPLFLVVVIIEVIIAPIPGGAVGYLGAAKFGFWHAWPLLYAGNVIGTVTVFYLARRLGTPIFEENVGEKTRTRYNRMLDDHPLLLWLVYSVPVVPVDVLSVLAGLSKMSARRFFLIALSGYIIYTAIVAWVGSSVAELIGITDAVSVFGFVLLAGLAWWLWRHHRK
ncbi:MAG TPA: VTT domain-containing protein [Longimicrobiales bacterium]